jgi:hypothetical protein
VTVFLSAIPIRILSKSAERSPVPLDDGGGGGGGGGGGKGKNKNKSELQANPSQSISGVAQFPWGQQFWPLQATAPRYYYGPPSHTQFFPDPHGQFVHFI